MSLKLFLLPLWVSAALAAPPLVLPQAIGTLRTKDGRTFEKVTVLSQDAVGVKIVHAGGTARIGFERLPEELAKHFHYNPEAAEAQKRQEAARDEAHRAEPEQKPKPQPEPETPEAEGDATADADSPPLEKEPALTGKAAARIAELEAYIRRLQAGIAKTEQEVAELKGKEEKYRKEADTVTVEIVDAVTRETVASARKRSMTKSIYYRNRAEKEGKKIAEARRLVAAAQAKIARLRTMTES